jgi:hypothetical protein
MIIKNDLANLIFAVQDGQKIRAHKLVAKILGTGMDEAMAVVNSVWMPVERLRSYEIGYHIGMNKGREEADTELKELIGQSIVKAAEPNTNLWVVVWNYNDYNGQRVIWPIFQDTKPTEDEISNRHSVGGAQWPHCREDFEVLGPFDPMTGEAV